MGWHLVGPLLCPETPSPGWASCPPAKGLSGPTTVTGLLGLRVTQVPLPQFHPRSAPLRGRTRVTLCGMTFRSHSDLYPRHSPPGAYRVTVGQRGCTVLPEESKSHRCAAVPETGGNSSRDGSGAAPPPQPGADPPSSPHRPLPTSRRKDFVDVLVCELEPGGPTAAGGPADVVLTVEEPTGPSSFRVHGSATLGGFVFVVWPCAGGLGFGGGFSSPTHATDTISAQEPHISALHPPFGPRGGGTHLSLRGTHLSAGSSWRVMVNGSECPLVGQPRYAPALPPLGTAGSLARGRAQGPPPPSPPATAAVSPGRARRQFGARLPPPVAWAQPRWPCGSTGRSSWPLCPSSTAPTPSFRPSIPAAAMSECVGSLPMGGTALASPPPRPGWTRC